jgi:hypothetical protein
LRGTWGRLRGNVGEFEKETVKRERERERERECLEGEFAVGKKLT